MKYVKNLAKEELQGCEAYELAKAAGKENEFLVEADRMNCDYVQPSLYNAKDFIDRNREYLLHKVGLDKDGQPLKTKEYKVRYHVVCTWDQDVEALDPEEAREKANQLIWEDGDCCQIYVYRDGIQSAVPISCCEKGNSKEVEYDGSFADRTKWLEDRLAEAVNLLAQIQDGESVDDVTTSESEKGPDKGVDQFIRQVRDVYPGM